MLNFIINFSLNFALVVACLLMIGLSIFLLFLFGFFILTLIDEFKYGDYCDDDCTFENTKFHNEKNETNGFEEINKANGFEEVTMDIFRTIKENEAKRKKQNESLRAKKDIESECFEIHKDLALI